jgi:hypothetical protein
LNEKFEKLLDFEIKNAFEAYTYSQKSCPSVIGNAEEFTKSKSKSDFSIIFQEFLRKNFEIMFCYKIKIPIQSVYLQLNIVV